MFFKQKIFQPPAWMEAVNRKQRLYARRLADFLGRKAAKVPPARMRVYVVMFLLLMAGADLAISLESIRGKAGVAIPSAFGMPERIMLPPMRRPAPRDGLAPLLDSIRRQPGGGQLLDSLLRARPGLADTLRWVEGMER